MVSFCRLAKEEEVAVRDILGEEKRGKSLEVNTMRFVCQGKDDILLSLFLSVCLYNHVHRSEQTLNTNLMKEEEEMKEQKTI